MHMRRLEVLMTAMLLCSSALPSFVFSVGEFGVKTNGLNYRLEFAAMIAICAAYFLPAYAAAWVLTGLPGGDNAAHGSRNSSWIGVAATCLTGFGYYLVGRAKLPVLRVIGEHLTVVLLTWLLVVTACWLVYSKSTQRRE